ncbi:MAG TPA: hypothetical protein VGM06_20085 [Polyangiaceae bacterium]|jgi:hypothetical protein
MSEFSPQVDDLIVFFKDGANVERRWVPHEVYANDELAIPPATLDALVPNAKGTAFSECDAKEGGAFYFANLSLLMSPESTKSEDFPLVHQLKKYKKAAPDAEDLVLVPYDKKGAAYLVSKELYMACPTMLDTEATDPESLVTDGVVLANMPKVDLSGYTCYLLNLLSLRSNALHPDDGKSDHAKRLSNALKARRTT